MRRTELDEIEQKMLQAGFWNDQEKAQLVVAQKKKCVVVVQPIEELEQLLEDDHVMLELAEEDPGSVEEDLQELGRRIGEMLDKLEFQLMLGGEHDDKNATLTLQSGAGGVDASDWTEMLLRMYVRWSGNQDFDVEELDLQSAEEAGIRSATILIKGAYAYGHLKAEQGVHRLVRISPFDANSRRQTSFASVEVVPEMDDEIEVEIVDKDLRVDTFRASGAGGQHVNKTDSAVRMTHIPTGIVVSCQNQRSQHKNRAQALKTLKSKLYQVEVAKREEELSKFYGDRGSISWGNQIRSYVVHPYQMVKDLRTGVETSNVTAVLDGALDPFIDEYLKRRKHDS